MSGQQQNTRRRLRRGPTALALLVLLFAVWPTSPTQLPAQNTRNELKLKTAFIFKFTRYIRWPRPMVTSKKAFVITVYGNGPIGNYLKFLVRRKLKVESLPIEVKSIAKWSQYTPSHILVMPKGTPKKTVVAALKQLRGQPVLTVCHGKGLAMAGSTINFFFDPNNATVGFELNIDAIKRAKLTVPATLLKVADVVREK